MFAEPFQNTGGSWRAKNEFSRHDAILYLGLKLIGTPNFRRQFGNSKNEQTGTERPGFGKYYRICPILFLSLELDHRSTEISVGYQIRSWIKNPSEQEHRNCIQI